MLYLLNNFTNYGIAYPKKAKEIAIGTGIALTETYLTLRDLREKGLIWRVRQKYKYRYGLKEGTQLDNLVQLSNSLILGQPLPSHLRIEPQVCAELQERNELMNDIILREHEEQRILQKLSSQVIFLPWEGREKAITKCISRIIQFYSKRNENSTEDEIMDFLKKEFRSILSILYGAKIEREM